MIEKHYTDESMTQTCYIGGVNERTPPAHEVPPPGVDEMLGKVLDDLEAVSETLASAIAPLHDERDRIRDALHAAGALHPLPDSPAFLSLSAIDGAYTLSPLFVGDQINTLALSVRSDLATRAVTIEGNRSAARFCPHSPASELLAKVMMMSAELELLTLPRPGDTVAIIDGSHLTAATALLEALGDGDSSAARYLLDNPEVAERAVEALAHLATSETAVGCPKSDSSTDVSDYVATLGVNTSMKFPDKVIASLVLDEGEVLALDQSHAPWGRFDVMSRHVTAPQCTPLRDRITAAVHPLREHGIRVAHAKPHGSPTAIRIETKAQLSDFETADYWQAIAADCAPPHTQEPVAQFLADYLAKDVSDTAKVQLAIARLDISEHAGSDQLLELITRSYRTA